jgi:hypothetical protein
VRQAAFGNPLAVSRAETTNAPAAGIGGVPQTTADEALLFEENEMGKMKTNVKGLLNQRVRMGLFTVPLWVFGAVYLAKKVRNRRRGYVTA